MAEKHLLDSVAHRLFVVAAAEGREGELLQCLFDGGSATVDPGGHLILASMDQLQQMAGGSDELGRLLDDDEWKHSLEFNLLPYVIGGDARAMKYIARHAAEAVIELLREVVASS